MLGDTGLFLALFAGHQNGTQEAHCALAVPGQGSGEEAQLIRQLCTGGGGCIGEGLAEGQGCLGLLSEAELDGPCEGGAGGGAHRVLMGGDSEYGSAVGDHPRHPLFPQANNSSAREARRLADAEVCAAAHPRHAGEEGLYRVVEVERGVEDNAVPP